MSNTRFVSFFAGAGGLDLGLEQAGWDCAYASDIDPNAVATLEANRGFQIGRGRRAFANTFIERADIQYLKAADVLAKAGLRKGSVPLLAGGPPCQSWSSAGYQRGFDDPRGKLFDDFVELAQDIDARWVMLENVRGLLTARGHDGQPGSALHYIRKKLAKAGYQTVVHLVNAADYGVPQRRVRLFIFGFHEGDSVPTLAPTTHSKTPDDRRVKEWNTLRNTLAKLAPLMADELILPNPALKAQLKNIKPGSGVKSPGKQETTRPGGHWGYKQGAFVADLDQSARTVTANAQQDWIKDPKLGLRRLCPRECAAIQTFPAGWHFEGSRSVQYRLVGNAVPPLFAKAIGAALLSDTSKRGRRQYDGRVKDLLPLSRQLSAAIEYTFREDRANGDSRRAAPSRRSSISART